MIRLTNIYNFFIIILLISPIFILLNSSLYNFINNETPVYQNNYDVNKIVETYPAKAIDISIYNVDKIKSPSERNILTKPIPLNIYVSIMFYLFFCLKKFNDPFFSKI